VLNGLLPGGLQGDSRCRLALLPLGTGNSFVQHFTRLAEGGEQSPDGSELVLAALLAERRKSISVLRLDHTTGARFALGTVSLGFAADVAHRVNRGLKPLGVVGYTVGVLIELLRLRSHRLDATLHHRGHASSLHRYAVFAAAQNVAYTGGNMLMAPDADPTDATAELVTLDRVSRLELLRAFPRIFRGDHVDHPAITLSPFDRLELHELPETAAQRVMLDGEVLELTPRAIEVVAAALEGWI
jgi:diacylglycerol kinase (ATP)